MKQRFKQGARLGIKPLPEAMSIARARELDLVEVAPDANPPVCRIMDYGKYKYEEKKKRAAGKVKAHAATLKEVKLRPGTDQHDLEFKLKNARRFLIENPDVRERLTQAVYEARGLKRAVPASVGEAEAPERGESKEA